MHSTHAEAWATTGAAVQCGCQEATQYKLVCHACGLTPSCCSCSAQHPCAAVLLSQSGKLSAGSLPYASYQTVSKQYDRTALIIGELNNIMLQILLVFEQCILHMPPTLLLLLLAVNSLTLNLHQWLLCLTHYLSCHSCQVTGHS